MAREGNQYSGRSSDIWHLMRTRDQYQMALVGVNTWYQNQNQMMLDEDQC